MTTLDLSLVAQLVEKLENYYNFECSGGMLRNCVDWQRLKALLLDQSGGSAQGQTVEADTQEFPIMGRVAGTHIAPIPWRVIAPHEEQALRNHSGQTLTRLAERGGLSTCEAVAVLEDRRWRPMDFDVAEKRLREIVAQGQQTAQEKENRP